jgi:4a-hydroxytetrahydrobiopterin dehydratase
VSRLSAGDIEVRLRALPGWLLAGDGVAREFLFQDFAEAMRFVNRVADLAEAANHHPDILVRYNRVRLTLTTHDSGGLTARDFDLAQKIEA